MINNIEKKIEDKKQEYIDELITAHEILNITQYTSNTIQIKPEQNSSLSIDKIKIKKSSIFDYLINLYGKTKGFIKLMTYENLNNEFGDDALNNGVSIEQIDIFCKKYKISYYALDLYEKTIKYYIS
jgi:hypothetical protein